MIFVHSVNVVITSKPVMMRAVVVGLCLLLLLKCDKLTNAKNAGEALQCPPNTFPRLNYKQQHSHCVCPNSMICAGCGIGCTVESNMFKRRCVRGFKPSCGSQCRCSAVNMTLSTSGEHVIYSIQ